VWTFIKRKLNFLFRSEPWLGELDHIAINVPDMDAAAEFFACILGARELFRTGPFAADEMFCRQFGLAPGTSVKDHRMLTVGRHAQLSLFQYDHPEIQWGMPRSSDLGGYHVAFRVRDLEAAVRHLTRNGVKPAGPPFVFSEGPNKGISSLYFYSPWGLQIEFVQYSKAKLRSVRPS
jgi:catechol 2,3-dioxygenase-like lactoylglutathione lyase family enzyme